MAVKASPETIREMKREIASTIKDIQHISSVIRQGVSATEKWNDAQAAQFNMLMQQIARLTETPVDTLNAAIPKLEKLAQTLENYSGVKFGN